MGTFKTVVSKKVRVFAGPHGIPSSGKLVSSREKQAARAFMHKKPSMTVDAGFSADSEWHNLDDDAMDIDSVLDGTTEVAFSHAGGELPELLVNEMRRERGLHKDCRKRSDRVLKRNQAFQELLEGMTDSYLEWSARVGDKKFSDYAGSAEDKVGPDGTLDGGFVVPEQYNITVVDVYALYHRTIRSRSMDRIPVVLVNEGLVPCSPLRPTVAITIRTLELFRTASLRCPHLAVQNIVKTLCDLHQVPYKSHLAKQFTICYDVYVSILQQVDIRVNKALRRDSPRWRLRHACPACTYSLEDEEDLKFRLLFTMDGNDSLKRILRRDPLFDYQESPESGDIRPVRVSNELPDQREVGGDYYVPRSQVSRWMNASSVVIQPTAINSRLPNVADDSPCSERWKNMLDQHTSRAWGIFDETGVFVALCRHGFVLLLTDMVQSGEGSQYPLAVVETLLDTFGSNLGGGYDIGCRFKTTLSRSTLGPRAKELSYTSLVGAFHGHAHNRICQLTHLATYVEGLGLSDLEGAERLFSRSNNLASSVRHSSVFHRQQRIVTFFQHLDLTDTYENLSNFLINNYSAALQILATTPDFEHQIKQIDNFADSDCPATVGGKGDCPSFSDTFTQWLIDEKTYLENLSKEPLQETLEIEYYRRLESLQRVSHDLAAIRETWHMETGTSTSKVEAERRRLDKTHMKTLEMVHELERKLGIQETWKEGDDNWARTAELASTQQYRRCLDKLQQLVVSRMFELGKMNRSGTGYKLRQHIAKALKSRSQAIKLALQRFNDAAKKLRPPRETLRWEEVMDYAFLSEFDILADTQEDVRQRLWARPAARTLMDQFFKIQRAKEEIQRLNVEIPRLITFIRDEEDFLKSMEERLKTENPVIAHQISHRRRRFELANVEHIRRLQKLSRISGFTGSLSPGKAQEHIAGALQPLMNCREEEIQPQQDVTDRETVEAQEEEDIEEQEVELSEDLEVVLSVLSLEEEKED